MEQFSEIPIVQTYDYLDEKDRRRIGLLLIKDNGRLVSYVPSLDFEGKEVAGLFKFSVGKKNHVLLRVSE